MNKPKMGIVVNSLYFKDTDYLPERKAVIERLSKRFDIVQYDEGYSPDYASSLSVEQRIEQFKKALVECDVILSHAGGFNSIELLPSLKDISIPKDVVFIGSSDGTVLSNALLAKGAIRSMYGPDLMRLVFDIDALEQMVTSIEAAYFNEYEVISALYGARATQVLQKGGTKAKIIGGNNYTINMLQGTGFMPSLAEPFVALIEGEYDVTGQIKEPDILKDIFRNLDSVLLQKGASSNIQGLMIGQFPSGLKVNPGELKKYVDDRPYLINKPVVFDVPVGHATGPLALPIGKSLSIRTQSGQLYIEEAKVLEYSQ